MKVLVLCDDAWHPAEVIKRGLRDFGDAEILLKSVSATGGTQIAGYVRKMGGGRICALTPGHILSVWQNEMFRKLLKNALWWCAAKEPET